MSGGLLDSGRLTLRLGVITIFASALCVGCGAPQPLVVSPEPGVPGAAECPKEGPPTNAAQLKACVGGLKFDTLDLVGDEQRLMVNPPCPASCRHGPLARIEPFEGAYEYSKEEMQRGRIIARLFVRKGEKGYQKLALVPGYMTYWWVQIDGTGRRAKSIFISEAMAGKDRLLRTVPRQIRVYPYEEGTFKRSIAGWYWLDDDETAKGTCGSATCK